MRKILALALCMALLFALAIPAAAAVVINAPKATMNVDGTRDDGYGEPVVINKWRAGLAADSGAWGTIWAAWDDNFVYYYMEVVDTTPNHDHGNDYETDCVEFFFDWDSVGGEDLQENFWQVRVHSAPDGQDRTLTGHKMHDWGNMDFLGNDFKYIVKPLVGNDLKGGYIIEMAIPKNAIEGNYTLKEGLVVPVDFAIGDNQTDTGRESHAFIMEADDNDNQWQWPRTLNGRLTLVAAPAAPAVVEEEAPAAAEEAPAPAPAQTAAAPAPRTADPITLIAFSALISAAGVVIAKKRK
jgi:hypothetical protein